MPRLVLIRLALIRLAPTRPPRSSGRGVRRAHAGLSRPALSRPARLCLALVSAGILWAPVLTAHLSPAHAQQRLPTSRMSCADAKALVKRDGDVTLGTSGGQPERLVADRGYCELTEIAELRFVPTRDNPQCPVGYRCKAPEFEDWNWK